MPRLSVTIITKDEERDLPGCLASVSFADEVIVVDSGSKDRTVAIARAAGAKVLENEWPGFAAQKSYALQQATGDWVLNLDADERCSPELRAKLLAALEDSPFSGYRIRFRTWLFGRRLRFGGAGREAHLRLFRRQGASYTETAIHEGVRVAGRLGQINAPIEHHPYESLEEYFAKFNHYTTQVARQRRADGKRFSALCALRWPFGFLKKYVFQLGFLDGYAGWLHASLSGLYDFVKYAKLADLEREVERASSEVPQA